MNKLIFLGLIPILMLTIPNIYASDNNPTRFSDADFEALKECSNQGYNDGQNNEFDHEKNRKCESLNEKTGTNEGMESGYYLSFMDGCLDAEGNTNEDCERSIE